MTLIEIITTAAAAIIAVASVISAIYIVYVYRRRNEEALFLTRLVHRDVRVSIASAVILGYIVLALTGNSPGRPWGSVIIAAAVGVMMLGPCGDAYLWWKERRK